MASRRAQGPLDLPETMDKSNLWLLQGAETLPEQAPLPDGEDQPILDLDHLASFTDGDRALEDELAALYLSTAEVYLEQMREALAKGESWRSPAHALKGASSNLGARRVASLALAAEHASPSAALLDPLRAGIEQVKAFFASRPA
jgi:HPt (histidine-containing phosphotransfer) domain-containing protein